MESIWRLLLVKGIFQEEAAEYEKRANEIEKRIVSARKVIEGWEEKLSNYNERVNSLMESYNFIGFTKAFSEMRKDVHGSRTASRWLLWIIGFVALTPLLMLAYVIVFQPAAALPKLLLDTEQRLLILAPSVLTFEILCIYFFRVVLHNFRSASAQVSQLSLRMAACAFIQQYVEFSKGQKAETLDKFEALVFSGLAVDPGRVPSTFDGLEQLIGAVRNIQGKVAS